MSIITLTLNPVIDKSCSVHGIVPDRKLRCSEPVFEPGGGGLNVARAIMQLGGKATAVYPFGGHTGTYLNELMKAEGVPVLPVPAKEPTRENLIVFDTAANAQYRFGMPGPRLHGEDLAALREALESMPEPQWLVVSGSMPPDAPDDLLQRLSDWAGTRSARLVVDVSGEALRQVRGAFLVKPNLGELSALVGTEELQPEAVPGAAREVLQEGGGSWMAVSMGAAGALLIGKESAWRATAPAVRRRSTVGAGDSMVAGMVYRLSEGDPIEEAFRYGVACGTAATLNPGTELCHRKDADRLQVSLHPL